MRVAFLCIIFWMESFGQVSSGKVTYQPKMDNFINRLEKNSEGTRNPSLRFYKKAAKEITEMTMALSFDQEVSVFELSRKMPLEGQEMVYQIAQVFADQGTFYTKLSLGKQLILKDFFGKKQYVASEIPKINWKLTEEQKKIGEFVCYKAEYMRTTPKAGQIKVVAWYAPEIPFPYGPNEYVGSLPGLILELHDTTISYICTSIAINPSKLTLDWPDTVETISKEAYEKNSKRNLKNIN